MKIFFLLGIFSLLAFFAFAQDEEVIQKVRERYYRINGGSVALHKLSYQNTDYFIADNKLSIAKKETTDGKYEYYFDYKNGSYYPYFIFFEPKEKDASQLRGYFDDDAKLVLLKEGKIDRTFGYFDENPFRYLKQDAYNAINSFFNISVLTKNPNDKRIDQIFKQIEEINNSIVSVDTVEVYEDEGGSGSKFRFLNKDNIQIKFSIHDGGEHYGEIRNEYYSNGKIIYSLSESESWVGSYSKISATATFFENEKPFREDSFLKESEGKAFTKTNSEYSFKEANLESIIPSIVYK